MMKKTIPLILTSIKVFDIYRNKIICFTINSIWADPVTGLFSAVF